MSVKVYTGQDIKDQPLWDDEVMFVLERDYDQLQKENEQYKKEFAKFNHNHMTRDIKNQGQCPACDRYHEKQELKKLQAQNREFREALEKYRDIACVYGSMPISEQFTARTALDKHKEKK